VGSLVLPPGFIKSTVGAGDAFCAGMLYGIHEGWEYGRAARLGCACAAASLSACGATDGVRPLAEVLQLGQQYPEREPPA
jgi:sugar/nucleoside kinase (ribokinase family)